MKSIYKNLIGFFVLSALSINTAIAVPWCHQGTIVQIADVTWDQASIIANYPGSVPGDIPPWVVGSVDLHVTHVAANNYASSFSGGGAFGGYSVPQSGQVKVDAYHPNNYINSLSLYHVSKGVKFKINKCYAIPPMTISHALAENVLPSPLPGGENPVFAVEYSPLDGLDSLCEYQKSS